MTGPLAGFKIVEFAGIGPGPHACMMLADMGAEIIRIERKGAKPITNADITLRSRHSISLDLKNEADLALALSLCDKADALVEGFRPQVMERLSLSPAILLARNPKLVYGRMTGWGQTGHLSHAAGHDLNYIALSGSLNAIGDADKPTIPMNLVGDFGGGSTYLVMGILAALLEAQRSGQGQVVDAAITDGVANLSAMIWEVRAKKQWGDKRESNFLDGGAHFYNVYECLDGKFISLAPIEPQFYAELKAKLNLDLSFEKQNNPKLWPELRQKLATQIKTKTRDEWTALLEGTEVCYAPVLEWLEAPAHPQNLSREIFTAPEGVTQPTPAPRFSRTASQIQNSPSEVDAQREAVLKSWGIRSNWLV